jgi:hypothetical protein
MTRNPKSNLQRQRAGQHFSSSTIFRFRGSVIHLYVMVVSAVFITRSSCNRTNTLKAYCQWGHYWSEGSFWNLLKSRSKHFFFVGLIPVSVPLFGQWRHSTFRRRSSLDRRKQHSGFFLHWCCSISFWMYLAMVNINAYYICAKYCHKDLEITKRSISEVSRSAWQNSSFPHTKEDPGQMEILRVSTKTANSDSCYSRVCKSVCWAWGIFGN